MTVPVLGTVAGKALTEQCISRRLFTVLGPGQPRLA